MYQPKIKNHLIRKLYRVATRNGIPMTSGINAILEHHFIHESEPVPEELHQGHLICIPKTRERKCNAYYAH